MTTRQKSVDPRNLEGADIQYPYTDPVVNEGPVEAPPVFPYIPPHDTHQPDTEPGNPLPEAEAQAQPEAQQAEPEPEADASD